MNKALRSAVFALTAAASIGASFSAFAGVTVQDPWVRSTVAEQSSTGAFMAIKSDQATRLVEVSSTAAKTVQIHEMSMTGDVMKMRAVKELDIPVGKTVELKPGSYHIMLMDLTGQIKAGDTVPLKLVFEGADKKRETVEVKAKARELTGMGMGMGDKEHAGHPHHHME
jgi:copper(I)-binding protein